MAKADFICGFGLWADSEGILHHTYSYLGWKPTRRSPRRSSRPVTVKMLFAADEAKAGAGGTVTLGANGAR